MRVDIGRSYYATEKQKNKIYSADTLFSLLSLYYILSSQSILQHWKAIKSVEMKWIPICQLVSFSVSFPISSTLAAYQRNAIQIQSRGQNGSIELTCPSHFPAQRSHNCAAFKHNPHVLYPYLLWGLNVNRPCQTHSNLWQNKHGIPLTCLCTQTHAPVVMRKCLLIRTAFEFPITCVFFWSEQGCGGTLGCGAGAQAAGWGP